jgi:hypothetical protein
MYIRIALASLQQKSGRENMKCITFLSSAGRVLLPFQESRVVNRKKRKEKRTPVLVTGVNEVSILPKFK